VQQRFYKISHFYSDITTAYLIIKSPRLEKPYFKNNIKNIRYIQ